MIADSDLNIQLLDISAAPSSIVGCAVNVITGSYVDNECDMVIAGSKPLTIQRHFNSGNKKRGTLCHGWDLNLPSNIKVTYQEGVKNPITAIVNDRGADLIFNGHVGKKMKINKSQLDFGVTNCSGGVLSSRTNIRNKRLAYHHYEGKHCELHEESGEILFYKRTSSTSSRHGLSYSVSKNLLSNGCSIIYDYDTKKRLLKVTSKGRNENPINYIEWRYPLDFKSTPKLTLLGSDGRKICYNYQKQQSYDNEDNHRY